MTYKEYQFIKNNKDMLTIESKEIENKIKQSERFLTHLENALVILKNENINVADVLKFSKQIQVKWTVKDIQDMINCRAFLLSSSESLRKEALLLTEKLEIAKTLEAEKLKLFEQFEKVEIETNNNDFIKLELEKNKYKKVSK
jgi:hypothetical protein